MTDPDQIDDSDHAILDCLRADAHRPVAAIAKEVSLSEAAVRRRITRLNNIGVITGYTIGVNYDLMGSFIEAYIQLSFAGRTNVHKILEKFMARPEVREAVTLAGKPDAMLRVRIKNTADLRDIVMDLRESGPVSDTTTLVVMGRHWHGSVRRKPS